MASEFKTPSPPTKKAKATPPPPPAFNDVVKNEKRPETNGVPAIGVKEFAVPSPPEKIVHNDNKKYLPPIPPTSVTPITTNNSTMTSNDRFLNDLDMPEEESEDKLIKEDKGKQKVNEDGNVDNKSVGDSKAFVPPIWCTKPPIFEYYFDILKNGVIGDKINIHDKPYYIIGRQPTCDIVLDHPSISRQHAVIMHRPTGDVLLLDLNSTHGILLNQKKCHPNNIYRVGVGHIIKFGQSSRQFILEGGPFDLYNKLIEEEKLKREREQQRAGMTRKQGLGEDDGIMWGQREDAVEEDEGGSTENEEPGIEEMVFSGNIEEVEEFMAKQNSNYSKKRQREFDDGDNENMKDEDYISSDEDDFVDRTGRAERKRDRKKKKKDDGFETTETLEAKKRIVIERKNYLLMEMEKLRRGDSKLNTKSDDVDSLDAYMEQIATTQDKRKITLLEEQIKVQEEEERKFDELIVLSKPALEGLVSRQQKLAQQKKDEELQKQKNDEEQHILAIVEAKQNFLLELAKKQKEKEAVEEFDSDEEQDEPKNETSQKPEEAEHEFSVELPPVQPQASIAICADTTQEQVPEIQDSEVQEKKKKKEKKKHKKQKEDKEEKKKQYGVKQFWENDLDQEQKTGTEDGMQKYDSYEWVPPTNQSGDGITSLNEKFGY